jgi:hypothetical protein
MKLTTGFLDDGVITLLKAAQDLEDYFKKLRHDGDVPELCPYFLVCFDDGHWLNDDIPGANWTKFSELRRVIRSINKVWCFFFFLSTTGKASSTPSPANNRSSRILISGIRAMEPITETGFDQLVLDLEEVKQEKNAENAAQKTDLEIVQSLRWMAHQGRPL